MNDKLKLFSLTPVETKLDNGQTVYLRRLTAFERVEWLDHISEEIKANPDGASSTKFALNDASILLSYCLSNDKGERMFSDEEIDAIKQIDATTIDRLTGEALQINGLSEKAKDEVKKN